MNIFLKFVLNLAVALTSTNLVNCVNEIKKYKNNKEYSLVQNNKDYVSKTHNISNFCQDNDFVRAKESNIETENIKKLTKNEDSFSVKKVFLKAKDIFNDDENFVFPDNLKGIIEKFLINDLWSKVSGFEHKKFKVLDIYFLNGNHLKIEDLEPFYLFDKGIKKYSLNEHKIIKNLKADWQYNSNVSSTNIFLDLAYEEINDIINYIFKTKPLVFNFLPKTISNIQINKQEFERGLFLQKRVILEIKTLFQKEIENFDPNKFFVKEFEIINNNEITQRFNESSNTFLFPLKLSFIKSLSWDYSMKKQSSNFLDNFFDWFKKNVSGIENNFLSPDFSFKKTNIKILITWASLNEFAFFLLLKESNELFIPSFEIKNFKIFLKTKIEDYLLKIIKFVFKKNGIKNFLENDFVNFFAWKDNYPLKWIHFQPLINGNNKFITGGKKIENLTLGFSYQEFDNLNKKVVFTVQISGLDLFYDYKDIESIIEYSMIK